MRIAIRTDASVTIAGGHVRRCRALASALREEGGEVLFVSRPLDGSSVTHFAAEESVLWLAPPEGYNGVSFDAATEPSHASWARVDWRTDAKETAEALREWRPDWVVVDHYSFDARWHDAVRDMLGCRLLAIDDLADRALHVDILVDHNWAPDHRLKYSGRLRGTELLLGGPHYALLDEQYRSHPRYVFRETVRSIGICMGGTDLGRYSELALRACRTIVKFEGDIEVATTSANPHLVELRALCAAFPRTIVTVDQPNLARFFAAHDLQIGAGGGSTWERCCMGAPSIAMVMAENQRSVLLPLRVLGVVDVFEDSLTLERLGERIANLVLDAPRRHRMSEVGRALVDGFGAQRIAREVVARC
jgi:UDP-2,4-diacetamido-2,4,6-trideoxy-beta-L-altropyranose hydrolase